MSTIVGSFFMSRKNFISDISPICLFSDQKACQFTTFPPDFPVISGRKGGTNKRKKQTVLVRFVQVFSDQTACHMTYLFIDISFWRSADMILNAFCSFQPSSEQGIRQCLIVAAIKIGDILFVHLRISDLA